MEVNSILALALPRMSSVRGTHQASKEAKVIAIYSERGRVNGPWLSCVTMNVSNADPLLLRYCVNSAWLAL